MTNKNIEERMKEIAGVLKKWVLVAKDGGEYAEQAHTEIMNILQKHEKSVRGELLSKLPEEVELGDGWYYSPREEARKLLSLTEKDTKEENL